MAVFFDTGGGDIYGGPNKEAVLDAMKHDVGDEAFDEFKDEVFEVPGSTNVRVEGSDGNRESTLESEYVEALGSYCVASENC